MTTAREALEMAAKAVRPVLPRQEHNSQWNDALQWAHDRILALRSSVQEEPAARAVELLREAQKRVSRKWRGHQFDALWLEINDYLNASTLPQSAQNDTRRSPVSLREWPCNTVPQECVSVDCERTGVCQWSSSEAKVEAAKKIAALYFEIAEEIVGDTEVRRRFKERFGDVISETAQNSAEAQQEVNSGKAEAAQKQHGVNQGHTASEPPYRRTEFTAPAAASAPFAQNDTATSECFFPNCNCSGRAECRHEKHTFQSETAPPETAKVPAQPPASEAGLTHKELERIESFLWCYSGPNAVEAHQLSDRIHAALRADGGGAKVPDGCVVLRRSFLEYLHGSAPHPDHGEWFGEGEDKARGRWWWRHALTAEENRAPSPNVNEEPK